MIAFVVLSDGEIRRLLEAGRIGIEPFDESLMQPSSVDVRADRYFRVFRNSRYPYIDVKREQEELTELVEVTDGEPFILHPGEFVLGSTLERVTLPDDLVARLEGKALALDTEVPTTQGWRLMGELRPGDIVFEVDGSPTVVVAATEPLVNQPCREVILSDGTSVVCDAAHQWVTCAKSQRRRGFRESVVTTDEMATTLKARDEFNHHIRLAGPAQYPERELPIDPYVLGAWIGDGTSTAAEITCADPEILTQIARAGYAISPRGTRRLTHRIGGVGHTRNALTGQLESNNSLNSTLRWMGLLGQEAIPNDYLRASVTQRESLLAGLMDTDGYVDEFGRCELTTVSELLAHSYRELVNSLGFRATLRAGRATLYGVDHGPKYLVKFTPDRPVFRLQRKLARQKTHGKFHRFRAVLEVRKVASVPVRCIQVSSPTGTFLATRSYVPTHNSSLGRLGLLIHSTAGFIDPGWDGHVTLELSNVANLPITIYPEMKIGQLSFVRLSEPAERPYGSAGIGSKYQGQRGPTPSRYWRNFTD